MDVGEAVAFGWHVQYAFDSYVADPANLAPAADPRLSPHWQVLGHLVANDAVLRSGPLQWGEPACYGYLARSTEDPTRYVAAIRGTASMVEWIEDAEFCAVPHPVAGTVEAGFYGIYASMLYVPLGSVGVPAAEGINAEVSSGTLTVTGHSLGAPLASYLAFDAAAETGLGGRVRAVLFACPRPGDAVYGAAFAARVQHYGVWNRVLDVVPHVPRGPAYADLPGATWIHPDQAQAMIRMSFPCWHHLLTYFATLDYATLDWSKVGAADQRYLSCIKGPA